MIRDELRHLEHRHLLLSPEDRTELLVGVDKAPIDVVLQLVLLDVVPDLLGDIGAGMGIEPTTAASIADGVIGFMNAAFGLRFAVDFFAAGFFAGAFFAGAFFAGAFSPRVSSRGLLRGGLFADFFAAFLAVAIVLLPLSRCSTHCAEHSEADRPVTVIPAPSAATIAQFRGKGIPRGWFFRSAARGVLRGWRGALPCVGGARRHPTDP
jgi:hypothetical protein